VDAFHKFISNVKTKIFLIFLNNSEIKFMKIPLPVTCSLLMLLRRVIRRKIENSCWKTLPYYSGLNMIDWAITIKKNGFIKELWPAQHLIGEKDVLRGKSAVIQMPTSAGKTRACEIIIRSAFLSERTSLAVIIAPFRALCHEIYNDLTKSL
jgi:reverse gyrase